MCVLRQVLSDGLMLTVQQLALQRSYGEASSEIQPM